VNFGFSDFSKNKQNVKQKTSKVKHAFRLKKMPKKQQLFSLSN
jgi:hypothetical protein